MVEHRGQGERSFGSTFQVSYPSIAGATRLSGFVRRLGASGPLAAGGDGAHIPCCWGRWHNAAVCRS